MTADNLRSKSIPPAIPYPAPSGFVFAGRQFASWANGKKTYLMAGAVVAAGVAQAFGYQVPGWVDFILFGGALAAHRSAITEIAADVAETQGTLQTVVDMVSTPASK